MKKENTLTNVGFSFRNEDENRKKEKAFDKIFLAEASENWKETRRSDPFFTFSVYVASNVE